MGLRPYFPRPPFISTWPTRFKHRNEYQKNEQQSNNVSHKCFYCTRIQRISILVFREDRHLLSDQKTTPKTVTLFPQHSLRTSMTTLFLWMANKERIKRGIHKFEKRKTTGKGQSSSDKISTAFQSGRARPAKDLLRPGLRRISRGLLQALRSDAMQLLLLLLLLLKLSMSSRNRKTETS